MELNEYAEKARSYRMDSIKNNIMYAALGLTGEAGEVADKVKKIMRDNPDPETRDEMKMEIAKELGDCLWYIVAMADDVGVSLEAIAATNLDKLSSRKQRNKLTGSGDNR